MALPDTLTKREKKQIRSVIEKAKRDDGIPRTAQQSIPFQRMFPDGICRVSDRYYTKTIQFQDRLIHGFSVYFFYRVNKQTEVQRKQI